MKTTVRSGYLEARHPEHPLWIVGVQIGDDIAKAWRILQDMTKGWPK